MANFGLPSNGCIPTRPAGPPPPTLYSPSPNVPRNAFRPPGANYVPLPPPPTPNNDADAFSMLPPKAVVLYDFQPQTAQEVAVLGGDMVDCLAVDPDRKWLYVRTLRNTYGYVPSAYCRFMAVVTPQPPRRAETLRPTPSAPRTRPLLSPSRTADGLNHPAWSQNATPACLAPPVDRRATLSPGSIASASSGVSTCYSSNSSADSNCNHPVEIRLTPPDNDAFNRSSLAQYGSASGSSTSGSACERRIKMVKTNEQKKLLRAKSAEAVDSGSGKSGSSKVEGSTDKLVDMLWSSASRYKPLTAIGARRAPTISKSWLNAVPAANSQAEQRQHSANAPATDTLCETFV